MSQLAEQEYLHEPEASEIDVCEQCEAEEHHEKIKTCSDCGCFLCIDCSEWGTGECEKCYIKQPALGDFWPLELVKYFEPKKQGKERVDANKSL